MIFPKTDLGSIIIQIYIYIYNNKNVIPCCLYLHIYITNLKIYLIFTWIETQKKNYQVAKNQFLEIMRDHDMCQLNFQQKERCWQRDNNNIIIERLGLFCSFTMMMLLGYQFHSYHKQFGFRKSPFFKNRLYQPFLALKFKHFLYYIYFTPSLNFSSQKMMRCCIHHQFLCSIIQLQKVFELLYL